MPISEYDAVRAPLVHDLGRLQRDRRRPPPRNPGRADLRREARGRDRDRPPDVPTPGLEAPPRPQRGRTRPVPRRRAAPTLQPRARAPEADAGVAGQVRTDLERATGPNGRLSEEAAEKGERQ